MAMGRQAGDDDGPRWGPGRAGGRCWPARAKGVDAMLLLRGFELPTRSGPALAVNIRAAAELYAFDTGRSTQVKEAVTLSESGLDPRVPQATGLGPV